MTESYYYTKTPVNAATLKYEIEGSSEIEKVVEAISIGSFQGNNIKISFSEALSNMEGIVLNDLVDAHAGEHMNNYTIWCKSCANYYDDLLPEFPTQCKLCDGENISNITNEKQAILGKVVSNDLPNGSYVWSLPHSEARWIRYRKLIRFPSKLSFVPSSINFENIFLVDCADLSVQEIHEDGFFITITALGGLPDKSLRGLQGIASVSFDWSTEL